MINSIQYSRKSYHQPNQSAINKMSSNMCNSDSKAGVPEFFQGMMFCDGNDQNKTHHKPVNEAETETDAHKLQQTADPINRKKDGA